MYNRPYELAVTQHSAHGRSNWREEAEDLRQIYSIGLLAISIIGRITISHGIYNYCNWHFRLEPNTNGGSYFQFCMTTVVLAGLIYENCESSYIDDIINCSWPT